jgi:citrate synthase
VLKMLARIGTADAIPAFLEGVKNKKEKMSGFGHRVYKNFDPRANVIRGVAETVFSLVGRDPLIDVAVQLEKAARSDPYFVDRNLYPNVDFYSGLVYRALGFPPEFFTVLFAIPRAAGYLAHWREQLTDPDLKIMRPQQIYQGAWLRPYVDINARPSAAEDSMWQVEPSNASRRRLAGMSVDADAVAAAARDDMRPLGVAGRADSSGRRNPSAIDLSPAFSSGVTPGDATSGINNLLDREMN